MELLDKKLQKLIKYFIKEWIKMEHMKIGKSLYTWIKTFVIIIISIMLLLIALTNWMLHSFSNEIKDLNYSLTSIVQKSVDIRLKDIFDFTTQLELNNTNLKISSEENFDSINKQSVYSFHKQINDYKLSNTFIEEIFIYYPKIDYVIGNLGNFKSKEYYILNNNLKYDGYKSWMDTILLQKNGAYFFYKDSSGAYDLYFTKQLTNTNSNRKSILVIKIKKEEVLKILSEQDNTTPNSLTAIVSEDNKVYTYYGNDSYLDLLDSFSEKGDTKSMMNIGDYLSIRRVSDFYGMKYVTIMNQKDILKSTYSLRNIAYISLLFCMAFGIILFIIIGKRNSRPVVNLMKKFPEKPLIDKTSFIDEYSFINNKIDHMLEDNQKSSEKLEEQREIIEGIFLSNLLSNEERNNSVIFASIQRYNLQFDYSLFQIILIRNETLIDNEEKKHLISKIVNHIKNKKLELYMIATEYDGDIVLLFNMDHDYTMDKMVEIIKDLQPNLKRKSNIILGGIFDTMSHIVTSYYQALMAADNCEALDDSMVIYNTVRSNITATINHSSSFMTEYELDMLEGNYEEAQKRIDNLFNQYIVLDKFAFTSRCKKYAVLNHLIEAMSKIEDKDFNQELYYNQLSSIKDNQELLKVMHKIFDELITRSKIKQSDSKEEIEEKAKEYIHKNYENPMLGLYAISEYLEVSNTYISTVFKKKYNIGITQYINKLRIEKAKKLILNTEYNMKEIAVRVGFSTDVTFIRVFKQFENITPGKYRENKIILKN